MAPKCELLYTDTDSLLLEIETDDVYKDIETNKILYDTSDYPKEHPLYSNDQQKGLGQNERRNAMEPPIAEFVFLRSKMYSILERCRRKNIKKAKGVKNVSVKKQIMHEQYKETLFGKKQLWHGMNILRSEGHEICGMYVNKKSLSSFDSKRWIEEDGIPYKSLWL